MFLTSWYFLFYLFTVLDRLGGFLTVLSVLTAAASLISFIAWASAASYEKQQEVYSLRAMRIFVPLAILLNTSAILIPNKKDMLLIVAGGSVGEFVMHNEDAKAIPAEVTKWLRMEIKDASADLNPALQKKKAELEALDKEDLIKQVLAAGDSTK